MRGQSKMKRMQLGRTIVAERERAESDSERMRARKRAHQKRTTSVIVVLLMAAVLALVFYMGMKELTAKTEQVAAPETEVKIRCQVVDEDNRGKISVRTQIYIANLEEDLQNLGWIVKKVTLPTGMSRELYVDIEGQAGYFKVNLDRGTGVTAEDITRMMKYLSEHDLHPEYVDVRVEGKAYYR